MSALEIAVADYVALRRSLGFKFLGPERRLKGFVSFMAERKATVITYPLALEWATQPPGKRASWALRFSDVRGLSQYLRSREPRTAVLPTRVLPYSKRTKPYLYSDAEIEHLLVAAFALPPVKALRRWTYHCLFGLLIVTGMRIGEALALKRTDVDLEQGILRIQGAKFGKTRLVPLHPTSCAMLRRYASSAMRISTRLAVPISSWPNKADGCSTSTCIECSGDSLDRSDCASRPLVRVLAFMTCAIALPYTRWCAGIGRDNRSSSDCPCCLHIWVMSVCATPIGICLPVLSFWGRPSSGSSTAGRLHHEPHFLVACTDRALLHRAPDATAAG